MTQLEDALTEELRRVLGLRLGECLLRNDSFQGAVIETENVRGIWRPGETLGEAYERWKFHYRIESGKPSGTSACG